MRTNTTSPRAGCKTNTFRLRLATLASFSKWAIRRDRLERNPIDSITRPRRRPRLPRVPRWENVETLLSGCSKRDRALIALMAYGGLRRSEVASLNVGDFAAEFGLRRVRGKGGTEAAVPLPEVARTIVSEYIVQQRRGAANQDPLFVAVWQPRWS